MRIDRPLWAAGTLLSPQQFQQQAQWEAWTNECLARLAMAHPWGVEEVVFDAEALRLGKLKAERLRVRLPDGTQIDTDRADPLPPSVKLSQLAGTENALEVALALPLVHANGGNCVLDDTTPVRPTRFRQAWHSVQDLYGDEAQSIGVLVHDLTLRVAQEADADYHTCPVARLVRDGQGTWAQDPDYVPPLLTFGAHAGLLKQLSNLFTQLDAKRTRLMAARRESNERMADFAVADVSLFWLLNALNSARPILADLVAHPARHPEAVYRELARLAGSLLTFSLEHDIDRIPGYNHEALQDVFQGLFQTLSALLETSLPSRVIALELERAGNTRWKVSLLDPRLRDADGVDFYLSVRSAMPAAQLQMQFPQLCKVGVPDDVDKLINASLEGVGLIPLPQVPAAIPVRLENQYFALDLKHPRARAVLDEGVCVFYVPATLTEVKLELFAVLRG